MTITQFKNNRGIVQSGGGGGGGGGGLVWPTSQGLPKSGLFLKTVGSLLQYGFDQIALIGLDGSLLIRNNLTAYVSPSGLTPSTRYYVYARTFEELAGIAISISTDSARLGDDVSGILTGSYTHYREIGEFYVNSSGDIVGFKRVGDNVTFNDFTDAPIVENENWATDAYKNNAYPACSPARAEKLYFRTQSDFITGANFFLSFGDDDSNAFEAMSGSYYAGGQLYRGGYGNWQASKTPEEQDLSNGLYWRAGQSGSTSQTPVYIYLSGYDWKI